MDLAPKALITVSSRRAPHNASALTDHNPSTFWQSESQCPHTITLHFPGRVCLQSIQLLLNFEEDETYAPRTVAILASTSTVVASGMGLLEVVRVELDKPVGWASFNLVDSAMGDESEDEQQQQQQEEDGVGGVGTERVKGVEGCTFQIVILDCHRGGWNTRIRGIKAIAATAAAATTVATAISSNVTSQGSTTQQYSTATTMAAMATTAFGQIGGQYSRTSSLLRRNYNQPPSLR
ncbi:galactose-binding like protein [Ramicandelaber brevisporus]|nr:galactose-binding like protein [Ramicandelaber brevisporus]